MIVNAICPFNWRLTYYTVEPLSHIIFKWKLAGYHCIHGYCAIIY